MSISKRALGALVALTLLPLLALALLGTGQNTDPARAQKLPTVMSPNVIQHDGVPGTAAVAGVFSPTAPYFYVSGLESLSVIDVSNPKKPQLAGKLASAQFENEAMTLGERRGPDGKIQRFVLIGPDNTGFEVSPTDRTNRFGNIRGREVIVVDVTNPLTPTIIGRSPASGAAGAVSTSTHTITCMNPSCSIAYTAGGEDNTISGTNDNRFSIVDLSDLTKPRQIKSVVSPAARQNPIFSPGAGHYWNVDGSGIAWHTGSGGAAAFDISDPLNPKLLNGTNADGRKSPYNDFIHHNSQRPGAAAFRAGQPAALENGNVLLVTEEDYANEGDEIECDKAGTFQTWEIPDLDGAAYRAANPGAEADKGTIRVLDTYSAPIEGKGGLSTPVGGFCSAHWFDFHQSGIVAMGNYQQGLRLINTRDPRNLSQFGFATGGASEVWDAYWAPEREASGVATNRKTNVVYTVDAARGVEVFEVKDLPADLPLTGSSGSRGPFPGAPGTVGDRSGSGTVAGRGSACAAPVSRFVRGTRLLRSGLRVRGTARGNGCRVTKVRVAIARKTGKLCKFLSAKGFFRAQRSCRRTQYMTARGTSRWSLRVPGRLQRGKYLAWSRAIDSAGNVERKARPRNFLRLRVGRR